MFDFGFLRKGRATFASSRGPPSSPQPIESEEAELGERRGTGAPGTLAGERGALAWRQCLGPGGHTGARGV